MEDKKIIGYEFRGALAQMLEKLEFNSYISYSNKERQYLIELELETPHGFHWFGEMRVDERVNLYLYYVAEKIIELWSSFEPLELASEMRSEAGFNGYNPKSNDEIAEDTHFVDCKLTDLVNELDKEKSYLSKKIAIRPIKEKVIANYEL